MPFVSIVVPTRNRPDFVRCALQSILNQTFADFEVVVVDNHTGTPCRAAFDSVADERFRYVVPERPLSMCDNWEFGCRQATGDYVAVVIDKTVLRRTALEVLHNLAGTFSADLVSWRADAFRPRHFSDAFGPGTCYPWPEAMRAPQLFDPHQELARRFRMDVRRGTEGDRYFWGKICFGAFRRDLLDRIAAAAGRVFFPLTPDYTSMLAALALLCSLFAGYGMAGGPARSWMHTIGFAAILTITIYIIVDLEYPRFGLIRVDPFDQALVKVRQGMR